jgi:hypothetical protein
MVSLFERSIRIGYISRKLRRIEINSLFLYGNPLKILVIYTGLDEYGTEGRNRTDTSEETGF